MLRYPAAALMGAVVTLVLFFVMQELIAQAGGREDDGAEGRVVSFVDADEESETQTKNRLKPRQRDQSRPPPPPPMDQANADKPTSDLENEIYIPDWEVGGTGIGFNISDMDEVPLVRIEPRYPPRAESLGIEGWVIVEFTISAAGTVVDPVVVDAQPARIFNLSAKRAVSRWKYKPKLVDGVAVVREGVQVLLTFEMAKERRI